MKLLPHFRRITTLTTASILLCIGAASLHPVCGTTSPAESDAERLVLDKIQKGEVADLNRLGESPDKRSLSASFIERLLTSRDPELRIHTHGVWIQNAVVTGKLNLVDKEILHDVYLGFCDFKEEFNLTASHFPKGLDLSNSTFERGSVFADATIGSDFVAPDCTFAWYVAIFSGMRVGRDFRIEHSTFGTLRTSFDSAQVGGVFAVDGSTFHSESVFFDNMRVVGSFSAQHCTFSYDQQSFREFLLREDKRSAVEFIGAHLADVSLNGSVFDGVLTVDFTRVQADSISFNDVQFKTPTDVKVEQMTFKLLTPVNVEQLQFLLSHYNPEFYSNLEASFRNHGYADQADNIFIARKRAERREHCKDFLGPCHRGAWVWSIFQDMLAGYGKSLQNLLYWSLGFLLIGTFVFRSEKGMRLKDEKKDAPHYSGRYNAFWYSLDLFLPIIKLGEADVWTPKDDRRWANLYRRVHIIIGSLFVPIGLAAWTGIIK